MNMFIRILSMTLKTKYLAILKVGGRIVADLNREDTFSSFPKHAEKGIRILTNF